MSALVFRGVTKRYGRRGPLALDALSFQVPEGCICGFVGPNGAGKTTTFSLVAGYLSPDAGEVEILGQAGFDPWRLKGRLGVLPQDAELSDKHTPRELLTHLGRLQGMGAREAGVAVAKVLETVGLHERVNWRISALSHGMRRRVAVASALLGEPALVLLDEPTAGLDPVQSKALRDALLATRAGRTLVVSSHQLDELERLCDYVVMVDRGRALREGPIAEVTASGSMAAWLLAKPLPEGFAVAGLPVGALRGAGAQFELLAPDEATLQAWTLGCMGALLDAGVPVLEIRRGVSLERRFFEDAGLASERAG